MSHTRTRAPQNSYNYIFRNIYFLTTGLFAIGFAVFWAFRKSNDSSEEPLHYSNATFPIPNDFFIGAALSDLSQLEQIAGKSAKQAFIILTSQLANLIKTQMTCWFGYEVLKWVFSQMPLVDILLAPPQVFNQGNNDLGLYHPRQPGNEGGQVQLRATSDLLKEKRTNVRYVVRDEFFHVICDQVNSKKTKVLSEKRFMPFLNKEGEIDEDLRKKYIDTLGELSNNIKRFDALLNMEPDKLSSAEQKELQHADEILSQHDFQPFVYDNVISKAKYKKLPIKIIDGKRIIPEGTELIKGKPFPNDMLINSVSEEKSTVTLYLTHYGKTRLETCVKNLVTVFSNTKYLALPDDIFHTEMGSHFDKFDPVVKQLFGRKFCNYMTEYVKLTENYCAIPSPASCKF